MRRLDRFLQQWRARVSRAWVPAGATLLDIGCYHGEFLESCGAHIAPSIGIDPLAVPRPGSPHQLLAEPFREPLPFADASFDGVVLLAVLEHMQDKPPLARECYRLLRPGGRVILTVPSPRVDAIVHLLYRLGLADGMSLEEHHGYDASETPALFTKVGFIVEHAGQFQLGLNHLFVFRKP